MKEQDKYNQDLTWLERTGGFARDMTLRDHFAGLAMQGILMKKAIYKNSENSAKWIAAIAAASYNMADAMLKARERRDEQS
jgi:hypothetical protein